MASADNGNYGKDSHIRIVATQKQRKTRMVIGRKSPIWASCSVALLAAVILTACTPGAGFAPSDPLTERAAADRGVALLGAKNYKAALVELKKAHPFKTGDVRALMALAIASDMEGDFRTSDRAYDQLLTRETNLAMLFNNMGYSYMLRGDLKKAAQYISEAARRAPKDQTIQNNIVMLKKVAPL